MAEAAIDLYVPEDLPRRRAPIVMTLALITAVVLLTGVIAVAALTASTTNSPEDAVRSLLAAASSADVHKALGALDPAEASAMGPALSDITADLVKLGVLDQSANLSQLAGVGLEFDHVELKTDSIDASRSDLAAVTFTGGTVSARVDPSQLPLGSLVKGFLAGRLGQPVTRKAPLSTADSAKVPIVTVKRGSQWFVSVGYTVAEAARRHAGLPFPTTPVPDVGAASPTDAVRQLIDAATKADATRAVELTSPDDFGALHDYAPLFLSKLPTSPPRKIDVSSLDLSTSPVDGGTLVTVTGFTASSGAITASLAPGGCLQVTGGPMPAQPALCPPSGLDVSSGLGIVTVEHDGSWYVDPYRTALDDAEHVLHGLSLKELGKLLNGGRLGGAAGLIGLPFLPVGRSVTKACAAAQATAGSTGSAIVEGGQSGGGFFGAGSAPPKGDATASPVPIGTMCQVTLTKP